MGGFCFILWISFWDGYMSIVRGTINYPDGRSSSGSFKMGSDGPKLIEGYKVKLNGDTQEYPKDKDVTLMKEDPTLLTLLSKGMGALLLKGTLWGM